MMIKLLVPGTGGFDKRHEAGAMLTYYMNSDSEAATTAARALNAGKVPSSVIPATFNPEGYTPASGHGVRIEYPSGKARFIKD